MRTLRSVGYSKGKAVENSKENKMGTVGIPKLLATLSVPMIISMLVQALYNIVDSVFVAQFDNMAGTGALTIAFPIQNLLIALSVGMSVGVNALLSRSLGEKNREKASRVAGQGFFLMGVCYLIFLIAGLFLVSPYVKIQAGGDELLYRYSMDYITVVCVASFGLFLQVITEKLLQSTGKTVCSMIIQMTGAVTNIILDPMLIFGVEWLGIPAMGVKGAAIATVIGQCIAGAVGLFLNLRYNREITVSVKKMLPDMRLIKDILTVSVPSVIMQAIGSVMTFCMNNILIRFSQSALNVFGIYFKIQSFVFMPIFGLTSGMIPIVAYNYGAGNRTRVLKAYKCCAVWAVAYMIFGMLLFMFIPDVLLSIFNAGTQMLEIGRVALRTISLSFLFAGFAITTSSCCQALGKGIYSLLVSLVRQLCVLIPVAYLLSLTGRLEFIWWAFPTAELTSLALSVIFGLRLFKKVLPKHISCENENNSLQNAELG